MFSIPNVYKKNNFNSYFNFQHRLDLGYPLTYETALPHYVHLSPSEYLFCP